MSSDGPAADQLPARAPLPATADEAFDRLAGLVRRVVDVPVALVSLVDRSGQVFPGADGLGEPWNTERRTPLSHSFCQHVVTDGVPLIISDARLDPRLADNGAVEDLAVIAYLGVPILDFDGRTAGSLCAIDHRPRTWTPAELALVRDLAAAASAELQLRSAATRASASFDRTRTLLELSEALSMTRTVSEVAGTVAQLAGSRLSAVFGGIALLDATDRRLHYVDHATPSWTMRVGAGTESPSGLAVLHGRPLFFDTLSGLAAQFPAVAALGAVGQTFAYLPLQVGDRILGSLTLVWSQPDALGPDDRELVLGLGRHVAQAVDRALLLAERREAASTLQAALLPSLPKSDWLELAGFYEPAHATDAVGGDWYDAVVGRDGSVCACVGDVAGHDSAAAAAMGQISAYLRAMAVDHPEDPDLLLTRLDRVLAAVRDDRMVTAVVARIRPVPDGAELAWSNAGHPPPLLLRPGRPPHLLERRIDPLLGLRAPVPRSTHRVAMPPGSTLIAYTDGLVERRGLDIREGLEALLSAADRCRGLPLGDLLETLVSEVRGPSHDDDTIVFGARVPVR